MLQGNRPSRTTPLAQSSSVGLRKKKLAPPALLQRSSRLRPASAWANQLSTGHSQCEAGRRSQGAGRGGQAPSQTAAYRKVV